MIHYHGAPAPTDSLAAAMYRAKHACVSFADPVQLSVIAEVCQSFMMDSGAYSAWTKGVPLDYDGFCAWVTEWGMHPSCDFVLIPDAIDGGLEANRVLRARWIKDGMHRGPWQSVPVWHLDEPVEELQFLMAAYDRIAFGSAGAFANIGTESWWRRISEAMDVFCDSRGRPLKRGHGLRMLSGDVCKHIPFASADSTNVVRGVIADNRWTGSYQPASKATRAFVMAERIEVQESAVFWKGNPCERSSGGGLFNDDI